MTEQTTTPDLDVDTANLVQRFAVLNAEISERASEAASIKAELRQRLSAGVSYSIGGQPAVRVVQARKFNLDKAVTLLPSDEARTACMATTFDAKRVKSMLPPVIVDLCMEPNGDPRVEVL